MTDTAEPQFLHVGCGRSTQVPWVFAGWREVRLDIDAAVTPDIVASMTDLSAIADGTFDAVFSHHNLEHLEFHQVPSALREFRRVLRPDGWLLLAVPDLQSVAQMVAADKLEETAFEAPAGPIAPIDMIYGFRDALADGNAFMAHRTGFTASSLRRVMEQAGFAQVIVERHQFTLGAYGLPAAATASRLPHPKPVLACETIGMVAQTLRPLVAEHGRSCLPPHLLAVLDMAESLISTSR